MSNMPYYKGYHASVEYDADDGILVGTVFGVRDILAFHGSSNQELLDAFHDCIDTYLQVCAEQGISPDKEYKGSFNIRIPSDLHRQAALTAEQEGISLNQLIQQAIEERVAPSKYKSVSCFIPITAKTASILATVQENYNDRYSLHASYRISKTEE